jgi:hypothetical protein
MPRHQRRTVLILLTILLVASGLIVSRAARSDRTTDIVLAPTWQPDAWYQLEDRDAITLCDLPAGGRYRLVIGCLGDAAEEYQVRLRLTSNAASLPRSQPEQWALNIAPVDPTQPAPQVSTIIAEKPELRLGDTRDFFLHVTDGDLDDPKQYARISARSVACGQRVCVYVDQQLPEGEVTQSRIDELLRTLETDVLPRIESQFGGLQDVDRDGHFAVVLTPWLSRLQGGRTSIGGMVRSSDFRVAVPPPLGNRGDMLFLNSSLPADASLRDLLSHEVAHAACISQRLANSHGQPLAEEEEDWLSEALAHLAEPGWSNLDHRVAAFLNDPSRYPLVVPDYYRAGLWRNPGCRGATFLFTRWCVARHGSDLVRRLIESRSSGIRNLERATGRTFQELFREWSLSLASEEELTAPDLRAVLNRLGSRGLRPTTFRREAPDEQSLRVRGTAFTVVELRLTSSAARTMRIVGDSATRWQFSICRLPTELPSENTEGQFVANQ